MIPTHTRLTLDDLEALAFTYGGEIQRTATGYRLVGALIGGVRQNFYAAGAVSS